MRWDMYEVIIERPRGGSGRSRKGRAKMRWRCDPELAPGREPIGMSRGSKWLNENLAPLRRFLLSRVDQPWAAVHAEICATLRVTSAVQKHVLDHLRTMVYTRVVQEEGRLLEHGEWGVRELRQSRWSPVYVCPDSGVLKKVPQPRRFRAPPTRDVVAIDDRTQYRRIGGLWFRITLAPVPERAWAIRDALLGDLGKLGSMWERERVLRAHYGRSDLHAVEKRQIGKRELRRLPPEVR